MSLQRLYSRAQGSAGTTSILHRDMQGLKMTLVVVTSVQLHKHTHTHTHTDTQLQTPPHNMQSQDTSKQTKIMRCLSTQTPATFFLVSFFSLCLVYTHTHTHTPTTPHTHTHTHTHTQGYS